MEEQERHTDRFLRSKKIEKHKKKSKLFFHTMPYLSAYLHESLDFFKVGIFTQMNAIGIVSKAGRYGGTYAHSDIAMSFATWISPEFQLYIMKDYRRLKTDENSRLSLNWNLNREISKLNYKIHTDAIKEKLIPPELTPAQVAYTYANEADMLNVVLFGKTAKQWKDENPTLNGNMRDAATLNQLLVLANLESYNAVLINQGKEQRERMELLRQLAVQQLQTLEMVSLNNLPKLGTDLQKV